MNTSTDITPEEFEIIEQYIMKQLPAEEYDAFTNRLETDRALQNKLHSVRLLLLGVQKSSLTHHIEKYHQELSSLKKNVGYSAGKVFSMKGWLAAASIIIIAGIGALLYFNSFNKEVKLFTQYYQPDPGLISPMGISDNYLFDRAMIDYKTGNYAKAISSWENLLQANPVNDTLNYFLGSAYLAMDQNTKAIDYFQIVTHQQESYFFKDACWYMGLALLKSGKKKEAISFIEKSDHQDKETLLLKLKEE